MAEHIIALFWMSFLCLIKSKLHSLKMFFNISAVRSGSFKYPPCLPSIYLYNLKQTKIFAFVII